PSCSARSRHPVRQLSYLCNPPLALLLSMSSFLLLQFSAGRRVLIGTAVIPKTSILIVGYEKYDLENGCCSKKVLFSQYGFWFIVDFLDYLFLAVGKIIIPLFINSDLPINRSLYPAGRACTRRDHSEWIHIRRVIPTQSITFFRCQDFTFIT